MLMLGINYNMLQRLCRTLCQLNAVPPLNSALFMYEFFKRILKIGSFSNVLALFQA